MKLNKKGIAFAFLTLLGAEPPQWFANPSLDLTRIYGFGAGKNPAQARQNAMIDFANSLQLNIETSFEKQTKRSETDLTSSALQKVQIHTKLMNLFDIKVTKAECDQNQCYARIEILRSKLLEQLELKIKEAIQEIDRLSSPFAYPHKRDIIYPKILQDYALYSALGGLNLQAPNLIEEKPAFDLRFQYDGDFSKSFKEILEKAIQDRITWFGKISPHSDWEIFVHTSGTDHSVVLNISAIYNNEVIYTTSISDNKNDSATAVFFAKRLSTQIYKKIQKWENTQK